MSPDQSPTPIIEAATDHTGCGRCNSPICLALIRAATPPANLLDFLDRQLKLITSGHWSWRTVGYCTGLAAIMLVILPSIVAVCAVTGPFVGTGIGFTAATAIGGAGLYLRWRRNRIQARVEATMTRIPADASRHEREQPAQAA